MIPGPHYPENKHFLPSSSLLNTWEFGWLEFCETYRFIEVSVLTKSESMTLIMVDEAFVAEFLLTLHSPIKVGQPF